MEIEWCKSVENFLSSISKKKQDYIIRLNSGLFTRYTIKASNNRVWVKAHLDDSIEVITQEQLMDPNRYHFEEAISKSSLGKVLHES